MDEQKLTKHERRALRDAEQEDRNKRERRNKLAKKILLWTGGLVLVAGVFYGTVQLASVSEGERPGQAFAVQGREHIAVGTDHPAYNSNPPTSGWHYAEPAAWGTYTRELSDEQLLHNLEHGGIWISYTNVTPEVKEKLEKLARRYSGSVVLTPRSKNTASIVLASWGRSQELADYDEKSIVAFIKANKNKSPEALAR